MSVLSVDHQINDLPVCLKHSLRCQFSYTTDCIFHAFFHDTVTADKLLSVLIHKVPKDSRVYGRSDLRRAGCFRPVTDHPRYDGKTIDNGMFALLLTVSVQIGDSGATSTSGSDGATVCRKSADSFFDMNSSPDSRLAVPGTWSPQIPAVLSQKPRWGQML